MSFKAYVDKAYYFCFLFGFSIIKSSKTALIQVRTLYLTFLFWEFTFVMTWSKK